MAQEGWLYILVPFGIALLALLAGYWLVALLLILLAGGMAFFFRNPERLAPDGTDIVVAPADGRVTRISRVVPDDPQSGTVISIFLSVFDVHINRAPIAGHITDVTHTKGRFVIATRDEASLVNEQNALTIQGEHLTIVCKQIAGVLARRIVCWKKVGDQVGLGERFGLIKFSSRTDLLLPAQVTITVKVGDRVQGGTTIVGRISQERTSHR